jgi:hypothetical protein
MRGVSNYRRTKWFWLDSLLIPASKDDKDEETKKLKKLAISKIPAVYSGAFQVLVLDFELEHFQITGTKWSEVAAKAFFSAWAGRSWTFEEAAFSQMCRIRCTDGWFDPAAATDNDEIVEVFLTRPLLREAIPLAGQRLRSAVGDFLREKYDKNSARKRKMIQQIQTSMKSIVNQPLNDAFEEICSRERRNILDLSSVSFDPLEQFTSSWNVLRRRETSHPEDRMVILAHMLNLNAFQITGKSPLQGLVGQEEQTPSPPRRQRAPPSYVVRRRPPYVRRRPTYALRRGSRLTPHRSVIFQH